MLTRIESDISKKTLSSREWLFIRGIDRVEKRGLQKEWLHIWKKTSEGVQFSKLKKGHLIVHLPKDLEVLGHRVSWEQVSHIVPGTNWLAQLKPVGEAFVSGHKTHRYEGVVGEARYTIFWSKTFSLPLRLIKQKDGRTETTEVSQITTLEKAAHGFTPSGTYPEIEFSDEGDNEWLH